MANIICKAVDIIRLPSADQSQGYVWSAPALVWGAGIFSRSNGICEHDFYRCSMYIEEFIS